ncbi:hypothetical protein R6G85_01415 [Actinotignum urinale]|uniref:hypothetical protein n=1 Tax=Actinotignum urinale TaxID=190146 RepID=UPI002A819957|nr:hypothetical protein [Actinotignum urinale]MDY5151147.1 hypothetical protein [Actinotignum urinale]
MSEPSCAPRTSDTLDTWKAVCAILDEFSTVDAKNTTDGSGNNTFPNEHKAHGDGKDTGHNSGNNTAHNNENDTAHTTPHKDASESRIIHIFGRNILCWLGISSRETTREVIHIATPISSRTQLSARENELLRASGIDPNSPDLMQLIRDAHVLPLGGIRLIHGTPCLHYTVSLPTTAPRLELFLKLCVAQAQSLEESQDAPNSLKDSHPTEISSTLTRDASTPSTQALSTQAPSTQAPSTQAHHGSAHHAQRSSTNSATTNEPFLNAARLYEILVTDYRAISRDGITYEFKVVWRADSDAQTIRASYAPVEGLGNFLYIHAPILFSPREKVAREILTEVSRLLEGDVVMDSGELQLRLTLPMEGLTREMLEEKLRNFAGAATALRLDFAGETDDSLLTFG